MSDEKDNIYKSCNDLLSKAITNLKNISLVLDKRIEEKIRDKKRLKKLEKENEILKKHLKRKKFKK